MRIAADLWCKFPQRWRRSVEVVGSYVYAAAREGSAKQATPPLCAAIVSRQAQVPLRPVVMLSARRPSEADSSWPPLLSRMPFPAATEPPPTSSGGGHAAGACAAGAGGTWAGGAAGFTASVVGGATGSSGTMMALAGFATRLGAASCLAAGGQSRPAGFATRLVFAKVFRTFTAGIFATSAGGDPAMYLSSPAVAGLFTLGGGGFGSRGVIFAGAVGAGFASFAAALITALVMAAGPVAAGLGCNGTIGAQLRRRARQNI